VKIKNSITKKIGPKWKKTLTQPIRNYLTTQSGLMSSFSFYFILFFNISLLNYYVLEGSYDLILGSYESRKSQITHIKKWFTDHFKVQSLRVTLMNKLTTLKIQNKSSFYKYKVKE
jgi:hypothetical protein